MFVSEKSQDKADSYRVDGNNFYKNLKFYEALESYNKSLCAALPGSKAFALAYANRSAVYLEVKEYQLCLENIQAARKAGYPKDKIDQLNEREARCEMKKMEKDEEKAQDSKDFIKLSYPANEKIPFIVESLELRENRKYGRHVVTNQGQYENL